MTPDPSQRIHSPVDLGLVIRERRRALGLDQRTLAGRVGVSRQWIVEIEQGKARAGIGLVLRTLQALGLEPVVTIGEGTRDPTGRAPMPDIAAIDIDAVVERARGGADAVDWRTVSPKKSSARTRVKRSRRTRSSKRKPEPAPSARPEKRR
jgi:HTH-type transcriptional regulator/antitoxin HipB